MINLNQILPPLVDNEYRGKSRIALWFLYFITVVTIIRSCIHIFKNDGGAQSIATIPLDTYDKPAADTIILIFAYWGLSQLLMGIIQLIVILRYKSLVPLMYMLLVVEYVARLLLSSVKPIETVGQAPGEVVNYVAPPVFIVLFFLSLPSPPTTKLKQPERNE